MDLFKVLKIIIAFLVQILKKNWEVICNIKHQDIRRLKCVFWYVYSGIPREVCMDANNSNTYSLWNSGFVPKIVDLEVIVVTSTIVDESVFAWPAYCMYI